MPASAFNAGIAPLRVNAMCRFRLVHLLVAIALVLPLPALGDDARPAGKTMADVLTASSAADWRPLDPDNTLYLELDDNRRVVIELAPAFAPAHVDNIRALARGHYWDGLVITRVQDNYVVQWGDPDSEDSDKARTLGKAKVTLPAEFDRPAQGLSFTALEGIDAYAAQVGWSDGFPAARDQASGRAWLSHCYGMVGAGRGNPADSSNGSQLYVVIGHAPRHLDRNITTVGRVIQGIEHLSSLPRGSGVMGFHEDRTSQVPIRAIRLGSDMPEAARAPLEVLRTGTETFHALVESRRNRHEPWFIDPVGKIELCNVPIPVREKTTPES